MNYRVTIINEYNVSAIISSFSRFVILSSKEKKTKETTTKKKENETTQDKIIKKKRNFSFAKWIQWKSERISLEVFLFLYNYTVHI